MLFESLPNELLAHVLKSLHCPADLRAMTRASPQCFRVYKEFEGVVLSSIIQTYIRPEIFPLALAACDASGVLELANYTHMHEDDVCEAVGSFIEAHAGNQTHHDLSHSNLPLWHRLSRLCDTVDFFMNLYFDNAMIQTQQNGAAQGKSLLTEGRGSYDLSSTERCRLERALFRFEVFRKCFPMGGFGFDRAISSSRIRQKLSFGGLGAKAQDELASVYFFLTETIRAALTNVEDHLVAKIKNLDTRSYYGELFWNLDKAKDRRRRKNGLGHMGRLGLYLFEHSTRHLQGGHIENIVRLGLPFLKFYLEQDVDVQRHMFDAFEGMASTSRLTCRAEILAIYPVDRDVEETELATLETSFDGASSGWTWARQLRDRYLRKLENGHGPGFSITTQLGTRGPPSGSRELVDYMAVRDPLEWKYPGYIFWDSARLRDLGFFEITEEATVSPTFTRRHCTCGSVEGRTEDCFLEMEAMEGFDSCKLYSDYNRRRALRIRLEY